MAYAERRASSKGARYRDFYRDVDGRYKSAGTYGTEERALEVALEAEKHAAALIGGAVGGLDPVIRSTRTIEEYAPVFLRHHRVEGNTKDTYSGRLRLHIIPFLGKVLLAEMNRAAARNYFTALEEAGRSANSIRQAKVVLAALFTMAVSDGYLDVNPFHDVKTPKVPGPRAIKIATTDQYLKVRGCLPTMAARVFSTLLISNGLRFCEATGLRPADFDFEACILDVARSVVNMSREHHPQGKTFLVREYTKNGDWRRIKLDRAVVELVHAHIVEHGIGCRCAGCRQWAREYGRDRMRARRAGSSGAPARRWAKSRDADEPYLDEKTWNRIWTAAVAASGIPFKPTAYQVRHTHASWLIDAGESPKAVMHRLGQSDLRTTSRYVHVLDETGESAARRFEGLLPPLA